MNVRPQGMQLEVDLDWVVLSTGKSPRKDEPGMKSHGWVQVAHCCWWNKGIGGVWAPVRWGEGGWEKGDRSYAEAFVPAGTTIVGTSSFTLWVTASKGFCRHGTGKVEREDKWMVKLIKLCINVRPLLVEGEKKRVKLVQLYASASEMTCTCFLDKQCNIFLVPCEQSVRHPF